MAYKRSIFLINQRFQLRFSFYVCSWLFALSLIYPSLIYSLFNYFMRYLSQDPMGPDLARIQHTRKEMILLLVFLQLLFLVVTFLVSIFVSHKIAGPLYKLGKFFEDASDHDVNPLFFRKSDHFKELAEGFNQMMSKWKARRAQQDEKITQTADELEKILKLPTEARTPELERVLAELRKN